MDLKKKAKQEQARQMVSEGGEKRDRWFQKEEKSATDKIRNTKWEAKELLDNSC